MTERKPAGITFETWIDRQIRTARERGEFDDLPGAGRPIEDLARPRDEHWWIKRKLRDEGISYLPPALALKKEAAEARPAPLEARTEAEAREILSEINDRIRDAIRTPVPGPPVVTRPFDVERVLAERRARV